MAGIEGGLPAQPAPANRRKRRVDSAVRRYELTLQQGISTGRTDGRTQDQAENYRDALQRVDLRAEQARKVLMRHGVPPFQFLPYRNFTLRVDKLCREHGGETLRLLVEQAIERWTACGLDPEVLRAVAAEVLGVEG
jgi:hypothetical protein